MCLWVSHSEIKAFPHLYSLFSGSLSVNGFKSCSESLCLVLPSSIPSLFHTPFPLSVLLCTSRSLETQILKPEKEKCLWISLLYFASATLPNDGILFLILIHMSRSFSETTLSLTFTSLPNEGLKTLRLNACPLIGPWIWVLPFWVCLYKRIWLFLLVNINALIICLHKHSTVSPNHYNNIKIAIEVTVLLLNIFGSCSTVTDKLHTENYIVFALFTHTLACTPTQAYLMHILWQTHIRSQAINTNIRIHFHTQKATGNHPRVSQHRHRTHFEGIGVFFFPVPKCLSISISCSVFCGWLASANMHFVFQGPTSLVYTQVSF